MRFFLDHDVPRQVAEAPVRQGHDVVTLPEVLAITASDAEVFAHAVKEQRVLISCNRDDFLRLTHTQSHSGLIVLIRRRSSAAEQAHLLRLIEMAGDSDLRGNINFA